MKRNIIAFSSFFVYMDTLPFFYFVPNPPFRITDY